ncbi:MAG: response regulator [Pseudanabaenaceae cyanobacterium bins.39]|nr:response regulator [Pseudanabaenaceae cyanobacterium bins.39]
MAALNFKVLIVDDNEINRDMLARRLHRRDLQVSMAVNGKEALAMIRQQPYDLILLDIMMPEVDGYTVLRNLKNDPQLKTIPVIMISAIEEMDSVMKCMEIGADDYLTKPFDPEMLKSAVNRCLATKVQNISQEFPRVTNNVLPQAVIPNLKLNSTESDITIGNTGNSKGSPSLDEVVLRIMQTGIINRKGYLYFSKAIFNSMFEHAGINDQELHQICSVFTAIQAGRVKVVDASLPKS